MKTELALVAKLKHKNLVSLVGVCLEEHERLLVYEYMPNKSLDTILFDPHKRKDLDWGKRLKIISGVARGLLYLHEESRLKIVHRDLKPSNVLLDFDYTPKISDFGFAKLFDIDESRGVTLRIAGTFGYMAPEYARLGHYSVKSDVFSFGIMILEIITGKKNGSLNGGLSNSDDYVDLSKLVWEHSNLGKTEEILDPFLVDRAPQDQMVKLIQIGLHCVQDKPADRPTMSAVNIMICSDSISLQDPSRPTFCHQEVEDDLGVTSANEVSLSEVEPR